MKFRQTDALPIAAAKASISRASAFRFERDGRLPPHRKTPRGRRRLDPLSDIFEAEVVPMLTATPDLRAVAIFQVMSRRHSDLPEGTRRTLERRIR